MIAVVNPADGYQYKSFCLSAMLHDLLLLALETRFYDSHAVFVFECFLFCFSFRVHAVQHHRLDVPENKKAEPGHASADSLFMVCARHLVWLGLLFLHGLALESQGASWVP